MHELRIIKEEVERTYREAREAQNRVLDIIAQLRAVELKISGYERRRKA